MPTPTKTDRDAEFVTRGEVRRLVRRGVAVIIAVAAVASLGVYRAESAASESADTAHALVIEVIDRQVSVCRSSNDFRRLFREYLDTVAHTGGGPAVLTSLPAYQDLDAATQAYARSLALVVETNAADAAKVRAKYVAGFPIVDCAKLRADLVASTGGGS